MNLKRFTQEQLKRITAIWITTPMAATDNEPHKVSAPLKERTLVEGIAGTWHYHYSDDGRHALCGAASMPSDAPESTWGYVSGHLHERYCGKCFAIRNPGRVWVPVRK